MYDKIYILDMFLSFLIGSVLSGALFFFSVWLCIMISDSEMMFYICGMLLLYWIGVK